MPPNASDGLPQCPNEMARIVAGRDETPERRRQAFDRLAPWILAAAERMDGRFQGHLGAEFVGEALTHVWERLAPGPKARFDPAKGSFESWCRRVVAHRAIDTWRRQQRRVRQASDAALENQPDVAGARDESGEHADQALHLLVELRRAILDDVRWRPAGVNGVDYFAVLLLHLRLAVAAKLSEHIAERGQELPDAVSYLLARYVPWRGDEEDLRLKAEWPTLREVWSSLEEVLDRPPYRVSTAALCDVLTGLLGAGVAVTPDLWYQWLKRAKGMAKDRINPDDWDTFFAAWLPDRPPRPGEQAPGLEGEAP